MKILQIIPAEPGWYTVRSHDNETGIYIDVWEIGGWLITEWEDSTYREPVIRCIGLTKTMWGSLVTTDENIEYLPRLDKEVNGDTFHNTFSVEEFQKIRGLNK